MLIRLIRIEIPNDFNWLIFSHKRTGFLNYRIMFMLQEVHNKILKWPSLFIWSFMSRNYEELIKQIRSRQITIFVYI